MSQELDEKDRVIQELRDQQAVLNDELSRLKVANKSQVAVIEELEGLRKIADEALQAADEARRAAESGLESERTKVLHCPYCGKHAKIQRL